MNPAEILSKELNKFLKGKSCFDFKNIDKVLQKDIGKKRIDIYKRRLI